MPRTSGQAGGLDGVGIVLLHAPPTLAVMILAKFPVTVGRSGKWLSGIRLDWRSLMTPRLPMGFVYIWLQEPHDRMGDRRAVMGGG